MTQPDSYTPSGVRAGVPARDGQRWTEEEVRQLVARVYAGLPDEDIATEHERSIGGIQARVCKLLPEHLRRDRAGATTAFRALPDDYDIDAAILTSLTRPKKTAEQGPASIEEAIARYIKGRARVEVDLMTAIGDARRAGVDVETIRLLLDRGSGRCTACRRTLD